MMTRSLCELQAVSSAAAGYGANESPVEVESHGEQIARVAPKVVTLRTNTGWASSRPVYVIRLNVSAEFYVPLLFESIKRIGTLIGLRHRQAALHLGLSVTNLLPSFVLGLRADYSPASASNRNSGHNRKYRHSRMSTWN